MELEGIHCSVVKMKKKMHFMSKYNITLLYQIYKTLRVRKKMFSSKSNCLSFNKKKYFYFSKQFFSLSLIRTGDLTTLWGNKLYKITEL